MTVAELINQLCEHPPTFKVVVEVLNEYGETCERDVQVEREGGTVYL